MLKFMPKILLYLEIRGWPYFHHSLSTSEGNEDIIVPTEESNIICVESAYEHLSNIYGLSKEKNDSSVDSFQESVFSSSVLYNSLHKDFKQEFSEGTQVLLILYVHFITNYNLYLKNHITFLF